MGRAVRAHAVRRNARWSAMLFHLFLKQFQCGLAIPGLGNHTFQHLTPVINSTPALMLHKIKASPKCQNQSLRPRMRSNR
jgi:hypothetical protein